MCPTSRSHLTWRRATWRRHHLRSSAMRLSASTNSVQHAWERLRGERGVAVLIALLFAALIGAVAAGLIALTTTETLIGASFRHGYEAAYGAEAAAERALRDLAATPNWSSVLRAPPAGATSGFDDGRTVPIGPDGRPLDLVRLTAERQRDSDARDGPSTFGANSPQWRLYAHAPADALLPAAPQLTVVSGGVGSRRRVRRRWRSGDRREPPHSRLGDRVRISWCPPVRRIANRED